LPTEGSTVGKSSGGKRSDNNPAERAEINWLEKCNFLTSTIATHKTNLITFMKNHLLTIAFIVAATIGAAAQKHSTTVVVDSMAMFGSSAPKKFPANYTTLQKLESREWEIYSQTEKGVRTEVLNSPMRMLFKFDGARKSATLTVIETKTGKREALPAFFVMKKNTEINLWEYQTDRTVRVYLIKSIEPEKIILIDATDAQHTSELELGPVGGRG
jgi:hypothetical protein